MYRKNIVVVIFAIIVVLLSPLNSKADINLLPKPKIFEKMQGFLLFENPNIDSWKIEVEYLQKLPQITEEQQEAYILNITPNGVAIQATNPQGVFYAKQTLKQLVEKLPNGTCRLLCCKIIDAPAFPIRGFMHDTGRSYISIQELKKEVALLSYFKINTFHWHLTEDIAWRIESKLFPQLNAPRNMQRDKGKFYTQKEIRDFLQFCKEHYVLVIPEIDMPGHSAAFIRTFGVTMQSPEGIKILKKLMDEICSLFDVPYIHIGTDEVHFSNPTFVPEMVAYLRKKGKKIISWNPGWKYKKGEIDKLQLWSYRGKTQKGIPSIDSRYHYLNHFDTFADIIALYVSKIGNSEKKTNENEGAILAVWNDRKLIDEKQIILQNNFYPNMLALAERAWQGGGYEYFDKDGTVLRSRTSKKYIDFADFERRMLWHKQRILKNEPFAYTKQTHVEWNITDAFPNNGNIKMKFPPENYLDSTYVYQNNTYKTYPAYGAGIYLRHTWGSLCPGFYKNPQENHTAYAYTWVYSEKKQKAGLWVEFQNYSRSEKDLPPLQGKWDYRGSKIWLNDVAIKPPVWKNTHTEKSSEIPLQNENLAARKPIVVELKQGWNKVLIKLPVQKFTSKEVRLQKWGFTAIFVDAKTNEALENIQYSRNKKLK